MKLRKLLAILLAVTLACTALVMVTSADTEVSVVAANYKVISPTAIELTSTGSGASLNARKDGTIMVLADGETVSDATSFDTYGIILITNDYVATEKANTAPVVQEEIPTFSFEMDFGTKVTFDTAYMAIYHESAGIGEPADNHVVIETSEDGKVWVPVGVDGSFYYSFKPVNDWNDGKEIPYVGEIVVPLGEDVTAQYVRYTYSFQIIPEDWYWTWYTNVYEFCGFTELGVATFEGGREPTKLSADETEYLDIRGTWLAEEDDTITIYDLQDLHGDATWTVSTYNKADYDESDEPAAVDTLEAKWYIESDTVVVWYEDGSYDEGIVSLSEDDVLTIEIGGEEVSLVRESTYVKPKDEVSEEPSDDPSDDASEESTAGGTSSTTPSSNAPTTSGTSSTGSTGNTGNTSDDGGIPTWAIVLIVVAAVVIIGAVIVIVVVRKKKQ